MLTVTRKKDEVIRLYTSDGVIEVVVRGFDKGFAQARIGVIAPNTVNIVRREIDELYQEGDKDYYIP